MPASMMFDQRCWLDLLLFLCLMVALPVISSSQNACPTKCICNLIQHTVDCQNAGLRHIPSDLPDPQDLTHLYLSGNEIAEINTPIHYPNLKYLDISANKISYIGTGVLMNLVHLEVMILKENHLNNLQYGVFDDLVELKRLDLSDNELGTIKMPLFSDLINLADLNLAGNMLENVSVSAFQGMESLNYINLEDNQVSLVNKETFRNQKLLKSINLAYNHLESIPDGTFSHLYMLRELHLEDNKLTQISKEAFADLDYNHVSQLEKLSLQNNLLIEVPTEALANLQNLEYLDISQNPISVISNGAFHGLNHLRTIRICAMPALMSVEDYSFSELASLQEVQMHSNHKLTHISEGAFLDTPQLRKVDLHASALETISANLMDWENLELFDVRYNRWRCDCHIAWLAHILREQAKNYTRYLWQEVRCSTPEHLASKQVIKLESELLSDDCSDFIDSVTTSMNPQKFQDRIMIAIMCSVGGLLVIIIIILMCKYGSSYRTAYAPAMDAYVYRSSSRLRDSDIECQSVTVSMVSEDPKSGCLRSSLSSPPGPDPPPRTDKRRLQRVRFSDGSSPDQKRRIKT